MPRIPKSDGARASGGPSVGYDGSRTMSIRHGTLVALIVSIVAAGCGRVESADMPTPSTYTPGPTCATVIPQEEFAVQTSVPTATAEPTRSQLTVLPAEAPIPQESTFELYSDHVADWYKVYVSLPKGYDPQHPDGYPVIYLLDADWYFDGSSKMIGDGGVAGIVSSLGESGRIPKAIVVGIGYVERKQRGRDLLWAYKKFYAFLTEELIPFVDSEYRTDISSPRTLVGHSDGGYFTLYSFFQFSENGSTPFGQFIAISGDLTKNEWLPFREEGKMNKSIGDGGVVDGALFLAVGGQDATRFVTSTQDMAERLEHRQYQRLRFQSKTYRSDDHMSVVTPAIWAGLMWVFGE